MPNEPTEAEVNRNEDARKLREVPEAFFEKSIPQVETIPIEEHNRIVQALSQRIASLTNSLDAALKISITTSNENRILMQAVNDAHSQ
jgi:hypothetical protein